MSKIIYHKEIALTGKVPQNEKWPIKELSNLGTAMS